MDEPDSLLPVALPPQLIDAFRAVVMEMSEDKQSLAVTLASATVEPDVDAEAEAAVVGTLDVDASEVKLPVDSADVKPKV